MEQSQKISQFSKNIELIYESSLDSNRWPLALEALCEVLDADKAQMLYIDTSDLTFSFACGYGFDPYAHNIGAGRFRRYLAEDPVAQYAVTHLDEVFSDRRVIDPSVLHDSAMQKEIRSPVGMEYMLTVFITDSSEDWTGLCFFRPPFQRAFSERDEETLRLYLPHIKKAAHIQRSFAGVNRLKTLQGAVLDQLDTGLIVVDEPHHVVVTNSKAENLIHNSKNLSIKANSLLHKNKSVNSRLHYAIDKALEDGSTENESRRIAVRLQSFDDAASLLAVTTKLRMQRFEETRETLPIMKSHYTAKIPNKRHALISLCDPKEFKGSWNTMLEDLFDLTPAEASLANHLADDCTLQEAADALGRSIGTTRVQLQSIFDKTDTNRQSSLVRLLMSIP